MSRLLLCLPLIALLVSAPAFAESAKEHAAAAKKAEKAKDWKKARAEWDAAYKIEPNAEYLIGLGDAYAKLGDTGNAKKQYQAYMNDPLALDTDTVKAKIAGLGKGGAADDLGLDLGGPPTKAAAPADMGLDLDLSAPAKHGKKEKPAKKAVVMDDLGLDLGAPPAAKAKKGADDLGLDLAPPPPARKTAAKKGGDDLGLDLAPPPGPKKPETKVASNDLGLDLAPPPGPAPKKPETKVAALSPGMDLGLDIGPTPTKKNEKPVKPGSMDLGLSLDLPPPAKTEPAKSVAVASVTPAPVAPPMVMPPPVKREEPKKVEVAAVTQPPKKKAPEQSTSTRPPPPAAASSGPGTLAWVAAGVAVVGLGGGAFMYSKASAAQSDLHSSIRTGAQQAELLNTEKSSKSLAAVGLAVGLAAGLAAGALFVF